MNSIPSAPSCALPSAAALALLAFAAAAEASPLLHVAVDSELEFQAVVDAADRASEASDLVFKVEPTLSLKLLEGVSVESGLVFEAVKDLDDAEHRALGDHGLFAETLFLHYRLGPFALSGGKINPGFGVAWDRAAGFFGSEVAEDFYEQTERLGFSLAVGLPLETFGEHRLSGSIFYADTSFLSRSIFTNRGRITRADGGPANTERLDSFSIALDGEGLAFDRARFGYHLGYLRNAAGVTESEDETAVALALFGAVDLAPQLQLEPMAEYVVFDGAEGAALDRSILTLSLGFVLDRWSSALAFQDVASDRRAPGVEEVDLRQIQVSVGYDFGEGLGAEAGYKWSDETTDGVSNKSHSLGAKLAYSFGAQIDGAGIRAVD